MEVLVAGAGGLLGRELVKALNRRSIVPLGLAYSEKEFLQLDGQVSRKIACDVTQSEQLKGICQGIDVVISVIGITRVSAGATHMDVDFNGNLNLLREAANAGVKKFVFISPAGTDKGYKDVPLFEAKYRFEQELRKSGIGWLIFRSGGFFKDFADYGKQGSLVINGGLNVSTPVAITELAEIMVEDTFEFENKFVEVGGPEDLNWRDICRICSEALQKKTKVVSVPAWLCNAVLWVLRPFSRKYFAMGSLILYTSTHDLPTARRGKLRFADYVREYYSQSSN
jgi:uncharacterized protein YbjT (DUF2867 family)